VKMNNVPRVFKGKIFFQIEDVLRVFGYSDQLGIGNVSIDNDRKKLYVEVMGPGISYSGDRETTNAIQLGEVPIGCEPPVQCLVYAPDDPVYVASESCKHNWEYRYEDIGTKDGLIKDAIIQQYCTLCDSRVNYVREKVPNIDKHVDVEELQRVTKQNQECIDRLRAIREKREDESNE
jgi:hypothetical protein